MKVIMNHMCGISISISITILVLLIEVKRVSSFTSLLLSSSRTRTLRSQWMANDGQKDDNDKQKHSKKRSQGSSSRRPYYSYSYGLKTPSQWSRYFTEEEEETNCMMFLDVENIRGKSNFDSSHDDFMTLLFDFVQRHDDWLNGRMSCIMDHGSEPSALFLCSNNSKVSVIFSGPLCKADDVLVRDLQTFLFSKGNNKKKAKALIVTADNELMTRCRQSCHDPQYHQVQFIHPHTFLPYLEGKPQSNSNLEKNEESKESYNIVDNSVLTPKMIGNLEEEIQLRGAMYETQMQLKLSSKKKNKKKKQGSPKERRKLEKRARMICERLAQRPSQNIEQLITITPTMTPYEIEFQNEVLQQWQLLRQTAQRREMTGDRMLLAEHFRRILISKYNATTPDTTTTSTTVNEEVDCLAYQHAYHVQKLLSTNSYLSTTMNYKKINDDTAANSTTSGEALRVLVISDTHGMEEQLGDTLPQADVLIHLGDFSIDYPKYKIKNALQRLDHWLAKQPCSYKIVLRGNHDPPQWTFHASQTRYITRPQLVALAGGRFQVLCIPWISPRILASSWRKLSIDTTSNHVDILASHSPPKNILDRTYSKSHAGCPTLRKKVETQMLVTGPPRVWMCGHIHEGRGYTLHTFQKQSSILQGDKQTLVINAANANGGPAKFIQHGPILFDIPDSQQQQHPISSDKDESNGKYQSIVTFIEPETPFVPKTNKDNTQTGHEKLTNNGQEQYEQNPSEILN